MRRRIWMVAICGAAMTATGTAAPPAGAHGPCECLSRYAASPGQRVEVKTRSLSATLNPRRSQLPYGPPSLWRAHREGAPSPRLYRSRSPRRHSFRVPRMPRGRYVIAIWDGSEGGAHYTWSEFRVRRRG